MPPCTWIAVSHTVRAAASAVGLGHRGGRQRVVGREGVDRPGGVERGAARALHEHEGVGEQVLDGLERADRPAVLVPRARRSSTARSIAPRMVPTRSADGERQPEGRPPGEVIAGERTGRPARPTSTAGTGSTSATSRVRSARAVRRSQPRPRPKAWPSPVADKHQGRRRRRGHRWPPCRGAPGRRPSPPVEPAWGRARPSRRPTRPGHRPAAAARRPASGPGRRRRPGRGRAPRRRWPLRPPRPAARRRPRRPAARASPRRRRPRRACRPARRSSSWPTTRGPSWSTTCATEARSACCSGERRTSISRARPAADSTGRPLVAERAAQHLARTGASGWHRRRPRVGGACRSPASRPRAALSSSSVTGLVGIELHHGDRHLPGPLVGQPEHGAVEHGRMAVQHLLQLRRGDLEPVDLDHLLGPVGEVDPALRLEPADVAGAVPAVGEGRRRSPRRGGSRPSPTG